MSSPAPQPLRLRDVLAGVGLAALPFALFLVPLRAGTIPDLFGDNIKLFYPFLQELSRSLARGQLPLWSDSAGIGMPVLATMQVGALSPVNLILFGLLPFEVGCALSAPVHLAVALLGMYGLARSFGLCGSASSVASLSFAFGSVGAGGFLGLPGLRSGAWVPLAWWRARCLARDPGGWRWIEVTVLLTLMILGGHPQVAFMGFLGMGMAFLTEGWSGAGWRGGLRQGLLFLGPCLLSLGLSALQLLPTAELSSLSLRAVEDRYDLIVARSALPTSLVSLLFPALGSLPIPFLGLGIHIGVVPFVLALLALLPCVWRRPEGGGARPLVLVSAVLCAAGVFLAAGRFNPLFKLLSQLPGFGSFRHPHRYFFLLSLALPLMAGLGLHAWLERVRGGEALPGARRLVQAVALGCVLIAGGSALVLHLSGDRLEQAGKWMTRKMIAGKGLHTHSWEHYERKVERLAGSLRSAFAPREPRTWRPLLLSLVVLGLVNLSPASLAGRAALLVPGMLLLAVLAELVPGKFRIAEERLPRPGITRYLQREAARGGWHRVYLHLGDDYVLGRDDDTYLGGLENINMLRGIRSVGAFDPLAPLPVARMLEPLAAVDLALGKKPVSLSTLRSELPKLRALGVRFILSRRADLELPGVRAVARFRDGVIHRVEGSLTRANAVTRWRSAGAEDPSTWPEDFDPSEEALVEESSGGLGGGSGPDGHAAGAPEVDVRQAEARSLSVQCRSGAPALLVIPETHYPGWEATVDGRPAEVVRCNGAVRGVFVGPGVHSVVLEYRPGSFRLGARIAAFTLVLLLLSALGVRLLLWSRSSFGRWRPVPMA